MKIKMLVMDVDGTLTDGVIYMTAQGEMMKAFDIKDGYAIKHVLPQRGIRSVIITGRNSQIVKNRAKELDILELYQGVEDKICVLKKIAKKYSVEAGEIAYIGDDLNDLPAIDFCGCTACPQDAIEEVKKRVTYVCNNDGGRGAVREFVDWLIKNSCC